jgi:hypothetical protein
VHVRIVRQASVSGHQRSGLVVTGGWSRCAVASRIGSVAIACRAGIAVPVRCPEIGGWLGAGPRQLPGWRRAKFP